MMKHTVGRYAGLAGALAFLVATVSAQPANPRFGRWKLKSQAAAPQSNIMTYEPYNGTGMKITIDAVNAEGNKSSWGYTTMFDGKDEPVTGRQGTDSGSVRVINDKINEIIYKKDGKPTQILLNVLSADNKSIQVAYFSANAQGELRVTYATYEKMDQ
jgi:hypothetical protein